MEKAPTREKAPKREGHKKKAKDSIKAQAPPREKALTKEMHTKKAKDKTRAQAPPKGKALTRETHTKKAKDRIRAKEAPAKEKALPPPKAPTKAMKEVGRERGEELQHRRFESHSRLHPHCSFSLFVLLFFFSFYPQT